VKGYHQKKIQEGLCAMVFGNVVWSILVHWVQGIIKRRHILSYNSECLGMGLILIQIRKKFTPQELSYNSECLGMGLILVQIQKKITPQEHCDVWQWGKFEHFQHWLQNIVWWWGSFDSGLRDTPIMQSDTMFGYGV
jgi:hypothetical protein